jgi:REP element-mobilizing transposase RayT
MARKNRMSIPDAFYHVTTRIAHREMLLAGEAVKDRIMEIIYSTAIFSGVEVYAWCIMDNHLHILVHVPKVPWELWTEEGHEPDAYAFGMRPPECREPMWPSPSTGTVPRPRPAVGFTLEDDEFVERLAGIYGRERAERRVDSWHRLEEAGCAERAMADRERLCRRMYNISQFMKTLKERVTRIFNSPRGKAGHEGALWQGRFHSGVVEPTAAVLAVVAAYIEFNPVKAGIADAPGSWRWSSFSCALGDGAHSAVCRRMYERMLDCTWEEARARMEAIFADRLPEDLDSETLHDICERYAAREDAQEGKEDMAGNVVSGETKADCDEEMRGEDLYGDVRGGACEQPRVRASQAIHVTLQVFRGAFIGSVKFARRALSQLPGGFPAPGTRSARMCSALLWECPPARAA